MERLAFIPVRGGSKSIPRKNIRAFCGKPLVFWSLIALHQSKAFDSIVVATDDDEIEKIVLSFGIPNLHVYRRSIDSASDVAPTEMVMLEFINKAIENGTLSNNALFALIQATSPLTRSIDFENAIKLMQNGNYDSVLSCIRVKRFYWNEDGTPKNYDYINRPRRQEFNGELMENGAIYVSTVEKILKHKNRLSGRIGLFEMPEYTGVEIDEESDWILAENLMRRHLVNYPALGSKKTIRMVLSDVDGVLTDAGMYYSEQGDELKKFNTRDGMGFQILREKKVKVGIITSENTKIVERRANKLMLDYVIQGKLFNGKLEAVKAICEQEKISLDEVAYIGDDVNCMKLLENVGFAACPSDAMDMIKSISGIHVMTKSGGEGVLRELVEFLIRSNYINNEQG
ncbi:MAG: HAD hydrolase family protein [Ignavibacteria bacterium]|nr:HAD hydrolase family protein [Ignavibacteria bacterium]